MKLYTNNTTPFGRRILIVAMEMGIDKDLEIIRTIPYTDPHLRQKNPLGRIPVLETNDGEFIYDSNAILSYFQIIKKTTKYLPNNGAKQLDVLRRWAIGDGITTAGMNYRQNVMRHDANKNIPLDDLYMQRQIDAILTACHELEAQIGTFNRKSLDWGGITIACALDFINFRMPQIKCLKNCPKLRSWLKKVSKRPSFAQTAPKD